jgi:phage shock protein PspC (stress-responsive transcriptional regulator)
MDTVVDEPPALPPPEHEPDAPPPPPRLRRSRSRRMLAGVAGGIAERYDVDVSLVRVAFVVLAFAWGAGVVLYGAMWALVPREPPTDGTVEPEPEEQPTSAWLALLLLAGVVAFGLLVVSPHWGGPRLGGLVGLAWFGLVVGLLVVALRGSRRPTLGRVLAVLALSALSVVILVAAAFLAVVAWTGVPLAGGIGDRVYQPASLAQVQPSYHTAIGSLTVDLRRVHFGSTVRHVTATVAVGQVTVEVPRGVVVDVSAHSGIGNVVSTPSDLQAFGVPPSATRTHPQLVLTAEAGIGQVRLIRGSPG